MEGYDQERVIMNGTHVILGTPPRAISADASPAGRTVAHSHRRPPPSAAVAAERAYSFGAFRLIPHRQLLLHGAVPVSVGSRAFDLLHMLLDHGGEVVSKTRLIAFAWPDTFVSESNLKVNISALRAILAQFEPETPFIATIPGRGYRFVAPVNVDADSGLAPSAPTSLARLRNMPPLKALIGRDADIADLCRDLATTGLLTVTGAAGVGKTALAVAAARLMADHYEDGACFVDFATITDPRLVAPVIAAALGLGHNPSDPVQMIVDLLRGGGRLLVLDNCEHLSNAIRAVVDEIWASLPDLSILCTARERLGCDAERVRRLAPLPYPRQGPLQQPVATDNPAVALFLARARSSSDQELSPGELAMVGEICRHLDGLPLAIELAALQTASQTVGEVLSRLAQDYDFLNHGPRNAPSRQQGLMTSIAWSYRLLSDAEAAVFQLASVFAEPFTCDELIAISGRLELSPEDAARCVSNLAAKSLLETTFLSERLRYRMLNVVRHYAAGCLDVSAANRRRPAKSALG